MRWILALSSLLFVLFGCHSQRSAEDRALYRAHRQAWLSIFLRTCSHWGIPLLNYCSFSPDAPKRLLQVLFVVLCLITSVSLCVSVGASPSVSMELSPPSCCVLCCLHGAWFCVLLLLVHCHFSVHFMHIAVTVWAWLTVHRIAWRNVQTNCK